MKIALPIPSFLPSLGGAEIGLHNIALQLLAKGHTPTVITSYKHVRELRRQDRKLPYRVIAYPPKVLTLRKTHTKIGRFVLNQFHCFLQARYGFDFWHATFGYPVGVSVVEFCLSKSIPHLVRCVGEDIQVDEQIGYGMRLDQFVDADIRRWLPRARTLVAITDSVKDEYAAIGATNIVKIPNGVNVERFQNYKPTVDLRAQLNIEKDDFVFLCFGRQHPKKNFKQVIRAVAGLKSRTKAGFVVVIAGSGVDQLKPEVEKWRVSDIVRLHVPSKPSQSDIKTDLPDENVLDCYKMADAFVMPSIVETFGIVMIEAMASDLPVIAANSPGCRDVIENGKFGAIYDGSLLGLEQRMEEFLYSSELRIRLRNAGRKHVLQFDWSNVVDRYLELYRSQKLVQI